MVWECLKLYPGIAGWDSIYIYIIWVTDRIIVILVLSCFALAFPRLHKTFITDRGRPYTDTPFVILPGILKSSQPIGDDPNLCMALNLTYNFVRQGWEFVFLVQRYKLPFFSDWCKHNSAEKCCWWQRIRVARQPMHIGNWQHKSESECTPKPQIDLWHLSHPVAFHKHRGGFNFHQGVSLFLGASARHSLPFGQARKVWKAQTLDAQAGCLAARDLASKFGTAMELTSIIWIYQLSVSCHVRASPLNQMVSGIGFTAPLDEEFTKMWWFPQIGVPPNYPF